MVIVNAIVHNFLTKKYPPLIPYSRMVRQYENLEFQMITRR